MFCSQKSRLLGGISTALALALSSPVALAQGAPARQANEVPTPVEIAVEIVNGEVQCRPARLRLPGRDLLEFHVANRADQATMFVAPEFFRSTEHLESSGFAFDVVQGGFLVAPKSTVRVKLRSPSPGEYYYSCYLPGRVPTPQSSGFLIVVLAAG